MSIARQATYQSKLSVVRTFSGEGISDDNTVTLNTLNTVETLDGSSTPPVTKDACFDVTLSSGTGTIDLTALVDPNLGTIDLTGLAPVHVKFINPSTNANNITIAKGASTGYTGFGSAFSMVLPPGTEVLFKFPDSATNVSGSLKILDITGTGSQVLKVQITAG